MAECHLLPGVDFAPFYPAAADAPHIIIIIQGGEQHLKRRVNLALRRVDVLNN